MPDCPSVLVVDDNVELAENLVEVLELEGHEADFVGSGHDALERLRERTYDLVITDMRMPEISGLELVKRLKKSRPEIPIVVMTAFSRSERLIEAREHGALEVMTKPVNIGRMLELVELVRLDL